jgi:hypothetical protein
MYNDPSGHDAGCPASNPKCEDNSGYAFGFGHGYRGHQYGMEQERIRAELNQFKYIPTQDTYIKDNRSDAQIKPDFSLPKPYPSEMGSTPSFQPSNQDLENLGNVISHATSVVPVLIQGVEKGSSFNAPLSVAGGLASGYVQWQDDRALNLTINQRLGRAGISGMEGVGVSLGAVFVGSGIGTATGLALLPTGIGVIPGSLAGFVCGYTITYAGLNDRVSRLNPGIFTYLGLNP